MLTGGPESGAGSCLSILLESEPDQQPGGTGDDEKSVFGALFLPEEVG